MVTPGLRLRQSLLSCAIALATSTALWSGLLLSTAGTVRGATTWEECRTWFIHPQLHPCRCFEGAEAELGDTCKAAVDWGSGGYVAFIRCDSVQYEASCSAGDRDCGIVYNCRYGSEQAPGPPVNCQLVQPGQWCEDAGKGTCNKTYESCTNPVPLP